MLIEIHAIQNHSPANLNRDDLGAPKTCYFGGVLRSRISSQCIKRSIRMSEEFKRLCGGIRTRQLSKLIAEKITDQHDVKKRAETILAICGLKPKMPTKKNQEKDGQEDAEKSKMLVYTTQEAVQEMARLLQDDNGKTDTQLAKEFGNLISKRVAVPDMALSGRMLEPDKESKELWKGLATTVEAALQVAHAISTHEARPEVDYFVAADDIPAADAGAGYVDEAMFASACFYKYFSIHWETLVDNLKGFNGNQEHLAAHTIGAFIKGVALTTPSGKQNSFAAHNPPDGMLVEIKNAPISYANAFARPVSCGQRDIISQSIAQLGQYIRDLDTGYGEPNKRFWFSPNLRYPLSVIENKKEIVLAENNLKSLEELVSSVVGATGNDWEAVQGVFISPELS
ncbi:MAG: type I-E CRISPR-associated protein Cas7/Cse4/CasC [Desulfomonilaceae bacterium]|jgi:CRISPR system Cascade subunit CasC